ncbi:hypothetical protein PILCRDRAFT_828449 [Piloderma croceum F 1598]|uniref:Uncharacterized protein n=1 Tax=Piloderma croceum (strain F 1598) TaxID=765440 RepID=A0A0C3BA12_PILCF|nr:hypothetical protein PILCRDRAFT_828449 [Piloderma croceum F 1598]
MKRYGKMWNVRSLNKHWAKNLVTLRSDWRLSYDHGDWAFAPSAEILQKIFDFNDSNFTMPYPGYSSNDLQDYVFISLPSLKLRYIFPQIKEFEDDDTDDEDQEEEDGDEEMGENENEKENEEEEEGGCDGDWDIGDGNFTAYRAPFSDFRLPKHHAHPFFVIMNALPKLGANLLSLTPDQKTLFNLVVSIEAIWPRRLVSSTHTTGNLQEAQV